MAAQIRQHPAASQSFVPTTQAGGAVERISYLAGELRHDLGHVERRRLLHEMREMRRSLMELEYELLEERHEVGGDAC